MTDIASIAKLSEPDPEFAAFLKTNPIPKSDWLDIQPLRAYRNEIEKQNMAALGAPPPEVKESFLKIGMRDGYQSELKVFKPTTPPSDGSPLIVLAFGGGFIMGTNNQLTAFGRAMTKLFGATVISLSYRLAPEHRFPTGVHDAYDTVKWAAANAASLGADPSKGFILGGVSAGGNISAVIAQKAQEEKMSPPLTGVWLSVPLLFPTEAHVPEKYRAQWFSREQNKDALILDADAMNAVGVHLQQDDSSDWYSPYNSKSPHRGLPPTYIQVDGLDPLRDDGLIHEQVLREHGVKTRLDVWPGLPHAHFAFFPMLNCGKKALLDTFNGFGWLLGQEVTPEQVTGAMAPPGGA